MGASFKDRWSLMIKLICSCQWCHPLSTFQTWIYITILLLLDPATWMPLQVSDSSMTTQGHYGNAIANCSSSQQVDQQHYLERTQKLSVVPALAFPSDQSPVCWSISWKLLKLLLYCFLDIHMHLMYKQKTEKHGNRNIYIYISLIITSQIQHCFFNNNMQQATSQY